MSKILKLEAGQEVTINIPFTYTIGEEGFVTNKELLTIEDCEDEVRAELNKGFNGDNALLEVASSELTDDDTNGILELINYVIGKRVNMEILSYTDLLNLKNKLQK